MWPRSWRRAASVELLRRWMIATFETKRWSESNRTLANKCTVALQNITRKVGTFVHFVKRLRKLATAAWQSAKTFWKQSHSLLRATSDEEIRGITCWLCGEHAKLFRGFSWLSSTRRQYRPDSARLWRRKAIAVIHCSPAFSVKRVKRFGGSTRLCDDKQADGLAETVYGSEIKQSPCLSKVDNVYCRIDSADGSQICRFQSNSAILSIYQRVLATESRAAKN